MQPVSNNMVHIYKLTYLQDPEASVWALVLHLFHILVYSLNHKLLSHDLKYLQGNN